MRNLTSEEFVEIYIDSVLKSIQGDDKPGLDDFYNNVYGNVSERTGFFRREVVYLHHPFHWILFLPQDSFLKAFIPNVISRNGDSHGLHVKIANPTEKSRLVKNILNEHGIRIKERLEKLYKFKSST